MKDDVPNQVQEDDTYTWVNHLSEGGLSKPSKTLMGCLRECDAIFNKLNAAGLLIGPQYLTKHLMEAKSILCSEKIKKLFFRCRMYFKIRRLNNEILQNQYKLKRKFDKITK